MAKKNKAEETQTSVDVLNENLVSMGEKIQKNKKQLTIISVVVAVIAVAILVYAFLIRKPAINAADNAVGIADYEQIFAGNDSVATAYYLEAAQKGYDAGNRARLMAAINLYNEGNYEQALAQLNDYKVSDAIVGPAALSLKGDCYVNLENLDQAVAAYKEAVKKSDANPAYTPRFLLKLAVVYNAQGNHADEAAALQEIVDKYPQYAQMSGINVEKYLERAKLNAAK